MPRQNGFISDEVYLAVGKTLAGVNIGVPRLLREWSAADNSVENLADVYGFPYQREHGLARRNYDNHEDR